MVYGMSPNIVNASHMFDSCNKITNLGDFNTANVKDMSSMFANTLRYSSATSVINIRDINFNGAENTYLMFYVSSVSFSGIANLNIGATSINSMFRECYINGFTNVTFVNAVNTVNVFSYARFNNTPANATINMVAVENAQSMFYCVYAYNNILPKLITRDLINTYYMFYQCHNCTSIGLFDTSKVVDATGMFSYCNELQTIPNFNFGSVKSFTNIFDNTPNLTTVPNFDTHSAVNFYGAFVNCVNLKTVPQFNTINVNLVSRMFENCNNLTNASVQNIINMCLNSNIPSTIRNLDVSNYYSPFHNTKFDSSYYQNRLDELTQAGWSY